MKQKARRYFDPFRSWFDFDAPMPERQGRFWSSFSRPFVDSFETDDEIVITAELPGVKKEDLKLKVDEKGVSIKVEEKSKRVESKESEKEGYSYKAYSERFHGYNEYVGFTSQADPTKAKATFKNGVLEVRIPKTGSAKGRELKVD